MCLVRLSTNNEKYPKMFSPKLHVGMVSTYSEEDEVSLVSYVELKYYAFEDYACGHLKYCIVSTIDFKSLLV